MVLLNGLVLCVVVVMVVATVVMVDGLNVLLMFLNILGLMFRPENVFSSSSEESCSCLVFLWLIVIGISIDMLYDDSSGPVLGGLMFVMEFVIGKYRPNLNFLANLLIKKSWERISPFLVKGVVNIKFWDLSASASKFSGR